MHGLAQGRPWPSPTLNLPFIPTIALRHSGDPNNELDSNVLGQGRERTSLQARILKQKRVPTITHEKFEEHTAHSLVSSLLRQLSATYLTSWVVSQPTLF